jgi:hypothetical protein
MRACDPAAVLSGCVLTLSWMVCQSCSSCIPVIELGFRTDCILQGRRLVARKGKAVVPAGEKAAAPSSWRSMVPSFQPCLRYLRYCHSSTRALCWMLRRPGMITVLILESETADVRPALKQLVYSIMMKVGVGVVVRVCCGSSIRRVMPILILSRRLKGWTRVLCGVALICAQMLAICAMRSLGKRRTCGASTEWRRTKRWRTIKEVGWRLRFGTL